MTRDLRRLADTRFDVVIVGAGIYGAAVAWDATQRGLSTALIDRDDFGSGTSFNNLKTLHGGLRSLSQLNLRQMRLFIRERRAMARMVPHLLRPLPFVVAATNRPDRWPMAWRTLLAINDRMADDRNDGIDDAALHLPPGHVLSRAETLRVNPVISPDGVTGGAVWYDYQMVSSDRVTLSFVLSASRAGATAANHVRAVGFVREGHRITGVRAEDTLSRETFDIRGAVVVNAAGPWAASLLEGVSHATEGTPPPRLSRAMNLVTRPVVDSHACGGQAGGRFYFLVPWGDVSIFGTSHDSHAGPADSLQATGDDVEAFLREAREAFPRAELTAGDVRLVHRGLLPMVSGQGADVRLLKESLVVDHRRHGLPGLVSIFGVRYTTARQTAQDAVDTVFAALGHRTPPRCRTADTSLAGAPTVPMARFVEDVAGEWVSEAPAALSRRLAATYGTLAGEVMAIVRETPDLARPLGAHCAVTGAEVAYAARHEMGLTLTDVIVRRTAAGAAGPPGADVVERAAGIVAPILGWASGRTRAEVETLADFYGSAGPTSRPHFLEGETTIS